MKTAGVVGVALLGAAAVLVGFMVTSGPSPTRSTPRVSTDTAPVTRGSVTERLQIAGVLGFDGAYSVVHQGAPGVLTATPEPGATISRGGIVYAVGSRPVRLLYGAAPAFRDFATGMSDGADVKQLEENLLALGFDPGRVDERFTGTTAAAIRRWHGASSLVRGQVVFLPGALRVGRIDAVLGAELGTNATVLSATSTGRVVTAQLTVERQHLVSVNDTVQVSLSGVPPLTGTVVRVGRVAAVPSPQDGRDAGPATVPVTIAVTLPAGSPELDQAPVQVAITTRTRTGVLMVPVVALLARPGGGYQVRLASGAYVEVRPGLFDAGTGTVEVTGTLTEGELVEVPTR